VSGIEDFLASYGLAAVVVGTFFEGETVLVLAGLAAHRGYLGLSAVVAAGFAGTFLGDQLYFQIGRRHGAALLERHAAWRMRAERATRFLERHHITFILGFRFLYGLRTVSPLAVGMSDVPLWRYLALNAAGALAWSTAVSLLGYSLGEGAERVLGRVESAERWLFVGVAVLGAAIWCLWFVGRRRPGGTEAARRPE